MATGESASATDAQAQAGGKVEAGQSGARKRRGLEMLKWLGLAVVGFLLGDAYSAARDWAMDKPDYLQELTESQKQEFADLRASLRSIGGAIESGDRAAFNQVKGAIDAIEKTNAGLIQQLVVAKQAGISGGYDFILSEKRGIRIDPATVLGVENVTSGGVAVNLTSQAADKPQRMYMDPGEFLAYVNAQGSACKLSLLSFNDGAAAFSNHCG